MSGRRGAVAAERCSARAKATGEQCKRLVLGGGACRMHGGATRAATAKRLERLALAEQLATAPRRHAGEVLYEALHLADVLAQRTMQELSAGTASPKMLRAAVDASLRAAGLSRAALSAEAEAARANASNELAALHLRSALTRFMVTLGLEGKAEAEAALAEAVEAVASRDWMPLNAAASERRTRITKETGDAVAELISGMVRLMGINPESEWPRSVIVSFLRATDRGESEEWMRRAGHPPRSWWVTVARHACKVAGLPDPVPQVEILPPLALTDGSSA